MIVETGDAVLGPLSLVEPSGRHQLLSLQLLRCRLWPHSQTLSFQGWNTEFLLEQLNGDGGYASPTTPLSPSCMDPM